MSLGLLLVGSALACTTEVIRVPAAVDDGGTAPGVDPFDASTPSDASNDASKDSSTSPAQCSTYGGSCQDDKSCCAGAPHCSAAGKCCVGTGEKALGGSCVQQTDCCSGACDDYQCKAGAGMACTPGQCAKGLTCGTNGKCGLAVNQDCGRAGQTCASGLLCSNKVKSLGGTSSTTEPNKCCVPGGEYCGGDEDCCIEDPGITGVQCYRQRCKRSYGSVCTNDLQCSANKCGADGKCR